MDVIWTGPVSLDQIADASLPGGNLYVLGCTGDGTPSCGQIGAALGGVQGLSARVGAAGEGPVLAAFSAGGSALKRILSAPADRAQIPALVLADATYTTSGGALEQPLTSYAIDAAQGKGIFVATTSSNPNVSVVHPGTIYPSGTETADMMLAQTGVPFADVANPGLHPAPERVRRAGDAWFIDFGNRIGHGEHATVMAPQIFANIVVPSLAGAAPPAPSSSPPGFSHLAAFLLGVAAGVGATLVATRA